MVMVIRVREALESSLRQSGIVRKVRRAQAVDVWPEVVGRAAADVSTATSCKDGVLFVAVKNSMWANELSLLKTDIIRKLNQRLGRGTIIDIRFQARGLGRRTGAQEPSCSQGAPVQVHALTKAELDEIRQLSSGIADPRVQSAFVRALAAAKKES